MSHVIGAFIVALLTTLALASLLTPARWWRRPNVKALAVVLAGTWGIGSLLLALAPPPAAARVAEPASLVKMTALATPAQLTYQVFEDLNLRAGAGINARRLALVPAGATVTTTGERDGDWWQVRATIGGAAPVEGWVSSLWLRRAEEAHRQVRR